MAYKARTLSGAQDRVRRLENLNARLMAMLDRWDQERKLLARLAADTPQFDNPLQVAEAKQLRDSILAQGRVGNGQQHLSQEAT